MKIAPNQRLGAFFVDKKAKKNYPKNFSVSIDEFTVVFKAKSARYSGLEEYESDQVRFLEKLSEHMRFNELLGELEEGGALAGYDRTYTTTDVIRSVRCGFSSDTPKQGVIVRFTGQGLKVYSSLRGVDVGVIMRELIQFADENKKEIRFPRLDIALDFVNYGLKVDGIAKKFGNGKITFTKSATREQLEKGKRLGKLSFRNKKHSSVAKNGIIETLYLGDKTYSYLRIYNKKQEQLENKHPVFLEQAQDCQDWVRFEGVFRKDEGTQLAKQIAELSETEDLGGVLLDVFCYRFNVVNTSKQDYTSYWKSILKMRAKTEIKVTHSELDIYNLERSEYYFKTGTSGLQSYLWKLAQTQGEDMVDEFLLSVKDIHSHFSPNENHERWLKGFQERQSR